MLYLAAHGYVRYYAGPNAGQYEHRVIAGAHRGEVVHHRNGKRWDNRLLNLRVMTKAEHDGLTPRDGEYLQMSQRDFAGLIGRGVRIGNKMRERIIVGNSYVAPNETTF